MKSILTMALAAGLILVGCSSGQSNKSEGGLSGTVKVDGSSTVFPITEAVAEEFQAENRGVRVTVGVSGTGGGFKKFLLGETDINDASRSIKPKEIELAKENNVEYLEVPVAFDGISVVVNKENSFVDYLTKEELNKIWEPGSTVKLWSDVRSSWPSEPLHLYGPGVDSGTFDYFTEAINGKSQRSRSDFTASEDDNVLVKGVSGDKNALGFFGFSYYKENADRLKVVPIDGGKGPVEPTLTTINNGTYEPLSRPIFIYVSAASVKRPEVKAFVDFYLKHGATLSEEVGYVALPKDMYATAQTKVNSLASGLAAGD